jgi:hypothetical protein
LAKRIWERGREWNRADVGAPTSTQVVASTFGKVGDAYFMVEPAAAVIVSANSHLQRPRAALTT